MSYLSKRYDIDDVTIVGLLTEPTSSSRVVWSRTTVLWYRAPGVASVCGIGSWRGQRPSLAGYVKLTATKEGATAAGGC